MTCTFVRSATKTYHWVCLKYNCCNTETQREKVDKNDSWACNCPGCAYLNDDQKQKRHIESTYKELKHVTWEPTWESVKSFKTHCPPSLSVSRILPRRRMSLTSSCPQQT